MTEILVPLTHGYFARIDEIDAECVLAHKWHAKVHPGRLKYAATNIKIGTEYRWTLMHRFILNVEKGKVVDHKDRDGLNNTRDNMRVCTHAQNLCNRRSYGRSRYLGVTFDPSGGSWRKPWRARASGKDLGRFAAEVEAAMAYDEAAIKMYGVFARPNLSTIRQHSPDFLRRAADALAGEIGPREQRKVK